MPDSIRVEGVDELIRKLETLGRMDYVKAGVWSAAVYLKGMLAEYPEQDRPTRKSVYGVTWKTKKQRRAFFAKLRSGEIQVPYRRGPGGGRFKAKWTMETEDNGLTAVVGNNTTYGPLLMLKGTQSLYARRVGWETTDVVVTRERDKVIEIIKQSIDDGLEGSE